jgi:hypothetical protein
MQICCFCWATLSSQNVQITSIYMEKACSRVGKRPCEVYFTLFVFVSEETGNTYLCFCCHSGSNSEIWVRCPCHHSVNSVVTSIYRISYGAPCRPIFCGVPHSYVISNIPWQLTDGEREDCLFVYLIIHLSIHKLNLII